MHRRCRRRCVYLETIHDVYRAVVIRLVARLIGVKDAGWSRHARLAQEAADAKIELAVFIIPADPSAPYRLNVAMDGHHSGLDEGWSYSIGGRARVQRIVCPMGLVGPKVDQRSHSMLTHQLCKTLLGSGHSDQG